MTYREIIYSIMDLSKLLHDDTIINEEHVMFLLDKVRASLLWQKYKSIKLEVAESNYQTLCLSLETINTECGPTYVRSNVVVPKLMEIGNTTVYPDDYYQGHTISYVSREQMRFAGANKILRNIIYCSISPDGHVYLKSSNPQFKYLEKIRVTGVFESPMEASEYSCDDSCEPLDRYFPLEESLVQMLIDSCVKKIVGAAWRPADGHNNANDNLADLASYISRNNKAVTQQMQA